MSSNKEKLFQISRVEGLLQNTSKAVWQNPAFPAAHRPDIASLIRPGKIRIGTPRPKSFQTHPHLRPEFASSLREQFQQSAAHKKLANVSWYDYSLGETTFFSSVKYLKDNELIKLIFHEAGHSLIVPSDITPDQYTEEQRDKVDEILSQVFPESKRKTIDQSTVAKIGFVQYLEVEGRFVTSLTGSNAHYLNEIYPTVLEFITDQIVKRNGNIQAFDSAAASGELLPTEISSKGHANFEQTLFAAFQFIDWRYILDAFKTGDVREAVSILEQHIKRPGILTRLRRRPVAAGSGIFMALFEAMQEDEEGIFSKATGPSIIR